MSERHDRDMRAFQCREAASEIERGGRPFDSENWPKWMKILFVGVSSREEAVTRLHEAAEVNNKQTGS